jgi:hypothetical protein
VPVRLGAQVQEVLRAARVSTLQYVQGSSELGQARYAWIVAPHFRRILVSFMRRWTGLPPTMTGDLAKKGPVSVADMQRIADKVEGGLTRMELAPTQIICVINAILSAGGVWDEHNKTDKTNDQIQAWLDSEGIDAENYYDLVIKGEVAMRTLQSFLTATISPEHADAQWSRGIASYQRSETKVGRNQKCPCRSGKKFKRCCGSQS